MRAAWIAIRLAGRLIPMIGLAVVLLRQRSGERRKPEEEVPDYIKYGGYRRSSFAMELPMTVLFLPLFFAIWCGVKNGLEALAFFSAGLVALLSLYDLLLLCLLPWLRNRVSAQTCATLWLLPSLLYFAVHYLDEVIPQMPRFVIYIPPAVWRVAGILWAIGFLAVLTRYFLQHRSFLRELQTGEQMPDERTCQIWHEMLQEYGFPEEDPIPLRITSGTATPLVVGVRASKLRAYLPEHAYGEAELQLIFRHELCHITRGDGETKLFWCLCRAFCWFNPLIWIAAQKAMDDLELACDELVLQDADQQTRYTYARLLLDTAGDARGISTCLSSAAQTLRHRLKSVTAPRKVPRGTALLFGMMILLCLTQGQIAFSTQRSNLGSFIDLGNVILANDPVEATAWLEDLQVLEMPSLNKINNTDEYAAEWYGSLSIKDGKGRSGSVRFNDHWVSVSLYDAKSRISISKTYRLTQPLDREILDGFLK